MSERANNDLAELQRSEGMWSQAYVDVSFDAEDPAQRSHLRRRTVRDELRAANAPEADIAAIEEELSETPGIASPASRFILACDGALQLSEVLPGVPVMDDTVGFGPVPNVVPLLKHRARLSPYLLVEAGRDGGRIRLFGSRGNAAQQEQTVEGRSDSLHKVQAGGWSHSRYQNHSEEIWKQNESELAAEVDALVRRHRPRLLVLAGDVRAVQLLEGELGSESREILSTVSVYTRPEGSSDHELQKHLAAELEVLSESDKRASLERLAEQESHEGSGAQVGVGPVAHALQQGQVETLLIEPTGLDGRTLLALAAEPWVAAAPEEAMGVTVLDTVPAAVALTRAAVLTDAAVIFVEPGELPSHASAAAVLRWPVGPRTP